MAEFKLGLLTDLLDLYERIESYAILTRDEKYEIIEAVNTAIQITETEFGKRADGARNIGLNQEVGNKWHAASLIIAKYLPHEKLGRSLRMKGEAWVNIHKWSDQDIKNENINLEQIKERLEKMTSIKRKFLRPGE